MKRRSPSSFQKSAFIRWVKDDDRQTLVSETQVSTEELLEGDLIHYKAKSGFTLHGGRSSELMDFQVISTAKRAVIIVILLEGLLDFSYDDLRFVFDAKTAPVGVAVNLTKPAAFRRVIRKQNEVTKLNIILPIDWIKDLAGINGNVADFISQHLTSFTVELTDSMLVLASEIIQCGSPEGLLEKLNLEMLSNRLLFDIFQQMYESASVRFVKQCDVPENLTGRGEAESSLDIVVTYIEANLDKELRASKIAERVMMSESNLQRKFKLTTGYSIQSYIRRRRLEVARQHLERGVATVTEVAYNAGYRYPSNFTNAFKKMFGYPPEVSLNKK